MSYRVPDEPSRTWPEVSEEDVGNLAQMIGVLLGPLPEDVPEERLRGLARELAVHNGDEAYDTFEMIDAWIGEYLD